MVEKEIDQIKSKTTQNVLFLTIRNFGIQGVSTIGFFLLTLILGAGDVGLFAIVAESVSILGYFSDVGLASALIQQKDSVTKKELQSTFTIQQLLVLTAIIIISIIYPQIANSKNYGEKEFWILISLCYSFVAASLKTIPSVLLERKLNFKLISTIDVIENLIFYITAVSFALLGFGVYSYAIATFIRSTIGLTIIYIKSPWPVGFLIDQKSITKLFKFGIPFQLNSFIAVAKDRLSNLLVAGIIGRESFGILSWAQKGPRIPLSFMDAVMKVTFPTFARLQNDHDILHRSLKRSIFFISFSATPLLVGIALIGQDVIHIIPKYNKWLPAIIPLYFYSINAAIAAITTPLTNAFNAVGKIAITTKLMIMWTVLTWIFYPLLSYKYGYIGTAIASLIVGSSSIIVWLIAFRLFKLNVFKIIALPTAASLLMIVFAIPINLLELSPILNLIFKITISVAVYTIFSYLFMRSDVIWFYSQIKCLFSKKSQS